MNALSDEENLAVASRYAAATRGDDPDEYRKICAPGAVTWHNFDELEVDTEHTIATVVWLRNKVPDLAWHDVAIHPTPTGFVSQSIMTGSAPGGSLRLLSCLIVTVNDEGLVTRVEEYLDSAQAAALRG